MPIPWHSVDLSEGVIVMAVRYLCDHCGHRGVDPYADTPDQVLCEVCGETVMADPGA